MILVLGSFPLLPFFPEYPKTISYFPLSFGTLGSETIQWKQPNGITFIARLWGDEFFSWFETEQGYEIYHSADGWYYYAILDNNGEYTGSTQRVGIDPPLAPSYKLQRSAARIQQIKQEIYRFNRAYQHRNTKKMSSAGLMYTTTTPETLKLGIILVQFKDTLHYNPNVYPRIGGYLKSDFENELFSIDSGWYKPSPTQQNPSPHPEDEAVFGSMRDYWYQMSGGKLIVTGRVVNPVDSLTGIPKWINLDSSWKYYHDSYDYRLPTEEGITKALDSGYISEQIGDPKYFDKYVGIYAGNAYKEGSLGIGAGGIDTTYYQYAERHAKQLYEDGNYAFMHMGTHAHEFGHLIGFYDEYDGWFPDGETGATSLGNFDVMASGSYNGPAFKGECPATINPYCRIQKNWITPVTLSNDTTNLKICYNYNEPQLFRLNPINRDTSSDEHFLFESKLRKGFDLWLPTSPDSFSVQTGLMLIFHLGAYDKENLATDRNRIINADNRYPTVLGKGSIRAFFPADSITGVQCLNDTSNPQAIAGRNGEPAHFSLTNISRHKPLNPNDSDYTLIEKVSLKLTLATDAISQNTTWQYDVRIVGNVTVENGATLTILPGTSIKCDSGKKLTVNGSLIAKGTSSNPITFTSSSATPDTGDWYGIELKGSTDTLQYCNIKYATNGVVVNTTSGVVIEKCNIKHCSNYGVYSYNASTSGALKLKGTTIDSNTVGLGASSAWVLLEPSGGTNTIIKSSGQFGLYDQYSTIYMNQATIQTSTSSAVFINSGANVYLSPNGTDRGYNSIINNTGSAIDRWSSSGNVYIGKQVTYCVCDQTLTATKLSSSVPGCDDPCYYDTEELWGYNTIAGTNNLIWNGGSGIYAQLTYWDIDPPCPATVPTSQLYGTVYTDPALCLDLLALSKHRDDEGLSGNVQKDSLRKVIMIKYLGELIRLNPDSADDVLPILMPLVGPGGKYETALDKPWEFFLQEIAETSKRPELRDRAQSYRLLYRMMIQDYNGVITLANEIIEKKPTKDLWFDCQAQKVSAYMQLQDQASAERTYSMMGMQSSAFNRRTLDGIRTMLDIHKGTAGSVVQPINVDAASTPGTSVDELSVNFPNPFNPITKIKYTLKDPAKVTLKVYNMLGQEVSKLVDEYQSAGEKSISFNASDLPSGVYFYQLVAGNHSEVKKMVITK